MPTNDALRLEVNDFTDADHWRWVLKDPNGKFLTDHQVALDRADAEYEAFVALYDYIERHVAPDRWLEDEGRMVEAVGAWMGEKVLGPVGEKLLAYGTPVTVRVILPTEASGLLYRPLELAHVRGVPLAKQDVSLVLEIAGEAPSLLAHTPSCVNWTARLWRCAIPWATTLPSTSPQRSTKGCSAKGNRCPAPCNWRSPRRSGTDTTPARRRSLWRRLPSTGERIGSLTDKSLRTER